MAHSHAHSHAPVGPVESDPARLRRLRILLGVIVLPMVIATIVGLVVLWPGHSRYIGSQPFRAEDAQDAEATITSLSVDDCVTAALVNLGGSDQNGTGTSGTEAGSDVGTQTGMETDGSEQAGTGTYALLQDAVCARVTSGPGQGQIFPVHIPAESLGAATVGDGLAVLYSPAAVLSGTPYVFIDYQRTTPVALLAAVYLILIVAVAGLKGVRAVLGLGLAGAVFAVFMLPALLDGTHPLAVTLVGSMAMMLACLYLAHGISIRTTTALLGTVAGVLLTVALSLWGVGAASLTGSVGEAAVTLASLVPGLNMRALLTCGMVIAGLGVLNDVTITQASAVWELHAANPSLGRPRLFAAAMRIGRDHIASTVYTLAFAYAGTALPLVLAASLMDRGVLATLMSGEIAEEVVRTLISSIGLVLAIPATTAIATLLCSGSAQPPETSDSASSSVVA